MPEEMTISRDQFKRLCESLLKEAPAILKARDKADKPMDKKSALLQALFIRLQETLGLSKIIRTLTTRGFQTYEFSYREAIYELALEHAKEPFDYQKIVDSFLTRALKE
jgi:hypothetical protein